MKMSGSKSLEFKGQIIDIFEDYFDAIGVRFSQTGEADAPIIFGEFYDTLSNKMDELLNELPFSYSSEIGEKFICFVLQQVCLLSDEEMRLKAAGHIISDKQMLLDKIKDTFNNWKKGPRLALIYFLEDSFYSRIGGKEHTIIIETTLTSSELNDLSDAIGDIKQYADCGESIHDFPVPDNWNDYDWDEKLDIICEYMSDYTGQFTTAVISDAAYTIVT